MPPGYGTYGAAPPPPGRAKGSPTAIIAIFLGIMLGLGLLAVVFVLFSQPKPPVPPCPPGQPCAPQPSLPPIGLGSPLPTALPTAGPSGQPTSPPATLPPGATPTPFVPPTPPPGSDSPAMVSGTPWQSATLNYSFEYDQNIWTLTNSAEGLAVFSAIRFDAQLVIQATDAGTSPRDLINQALARVDGFMIGRVEDTDDYDALLGPSIGYVDGEGAVYSGTLLSGDGTPVAPGGVTLLASTDGRLTVVVVVIVGSPDAELGSGTHQHAVRGAADHFLKTFDWDTR